MSTTKRPRPWVATTRSLSRGWTRRSWTRAFGRQAAAEPAPGPAAVDRGEDAGFRAGEEEARVPPVLGDDVDRALGEVRCDGGPGLAEVLGPEDEGPVIVAVPAGLGGVGRAGLVGRGEDAGDAILLRGPGGREVRP